MQQITQKTYYCIEYHALERLICETFPCLSNYDILRKNQWLNNCCYERDFYAVEHDEFLADEEVEAIEELILNGIDNGNLYPALIYTALVEKGVVPEGDYLIKVSW